MESAGRYAMLRLNYLALGMPIHHVSATGGMLFCCPEVEPAADPVCTEPGLVSEYLGIFAARRIAANRPLLKFSRYGLGFAAFPCADQDGSILVLGPTPALAITDVPLDCIARDHQVQDLDGFARLFHSVSHMSPEQFSAACGILYAQEWQQPCSDPGLLLRDANNMPVRRYDFDGYLADYLFHQRENEALHISNSAVAGLLRFVAEGDSRGACRLLKYALESFPANEHSNCSQLEQARHAFIGLTTLVSHTITAAGMAQQSAEYLWSLYTGKAETARDLFSLNKLYGPMLCDFCTRLTTIKRRYSKTISQCCDYIFAHLHQRVDLSALAELTGFSPHYLSLRFRNETGQSIPLYVQTEKIREAKALLSFSSYNLVEISNILSFSSQSYFSTVFRRHTGMTPQKYREAYRN